MAPQADPPTTSDYASTAAEQWKALGYDVDTTIITAGIRLERLARLHDSLLQEALAPFRPRGVRNIEDFRLLALLTRVCPESITATEASKSLRLSTAATAARVEKLVASGLCSRSAREFDRRANELHITDLGSTITGECLLAVAAAHNRLLAPLDSAETEHLEGILEKLVES